MHRASSRNVICTLLGPPVMTMGLKILKAWAMPSPFRCSEILEVFFPSFPFGNKCTEEPDHCCSKSHIFSVLINRVEILASFEMNKREDHTVKNYNSAIFFIIMECGSAAEKRCRGSENWGIGEREPEGTRPSTKIGYLSFIEFPFEVFVKGDSHYDRLVKRWDLLLKSQNKMNTYSPKKRDWFL